MHSRPKQSTRHLPMNALLGDQQAGIQVDQKWSLFCQKLVIELAVNEERLV